MKVAKSAYILDNREVGLFLSIPHSFKSDHIYFGGGEGSGLWQASYSRRSRDDSEKGDIMKLH